MISITRTMYIDVFLLHICLLNLLYVCILPFLHDLNCGSPPLAEAYGPSQFTKNSVTTSWKEGNGYIVVPESVISVINLFPFSNKGNLNLFDVRYQLRLNDLYDFSSTSVINYDIVLRQLDFLDHILVGEKPLRFNQHDNRLYIDMDWENDLQVGEYLVIEAYRKLDPDTYTDVYNDIWLKRYTTALFKKQWGANLSKFNGVAMVGGVTLNGQQIYSEALQDIEKLESEIRTTYELNPAMMMG